MAFQLKLGTGERIIMNRHTFLHHSVSITALGVCASPPYIRGATSAGARQPVLEEAIAKLSPPYFRAIATTSSGAIPCPTNCLWSSGSKSA